MEERRMFSVRNVEKFLDDHPELDLDRKEILKNAGSASHKNVLSGASAAELFGVYEELFFAELLSDAKHRQMGLEDMNNI